LTTRVVSVYIGFMRTALASLGETGFHSSRRVEGSSPSPFRVEVRAGRQAAAAYDGPDHERAVDALRDACCACRRGSVVLLRHGVEMCEHKAGASLVASIGCLLAALKADAAVLWEGQTYTARYTGASRHSSDREVELTCDGKVIGVGGWSGHIIRQIRTPNSPRLESQYALGIAGPVSRLEMVLKGGAA
jgi:hypothetical protein